MGKFLRFALMFGPMIYKGIKKLMAKKDSQPPQNPESDDHVPQ